MTDAAQRDQTLLLDVREIEVVYDRAILGVAEVSLTVGRAEIVALLGANGAGKSTVLKAVSGLVDTDRGMVRKGSIKFNGVEIVGRSANRLAEEGIVHVLEGRHVFQQLTVEENLWSGAFLHRPKRAELQARTAEVYDWFPRLRDKRHTKAGLTSGGEQQMLAIGRGLLTCPRLVLLDEPSMGLAPLIVEEIFEIILRLNREKGTAFLLAEQNAALSLGVADRAYILDGGRVALDGKAAALQARGDLHRIYLGEAH